MPLNSSEVREREETRTKENYYDERGLLFTIFRENILSIGNNSKLRVQSKNE